MTIAGPSVTAATVGANVASLTSDKDRRDRAIRTSGLQSDTFPSANVRPHEADHAARKRRERARRSRPTASGDFTLHGITRR